MSRDETALLLALERQLMDPEFRRDRQRVAEQLAQGFFEFGASGRVWTRDTILDLLETEPGYSAPTIENFAVTSLADDVRLVTYTAVTTGEQSQRTLRSSIWLRRDERWQVMFHQGTRVPPQ